ncbi:tetratricopeptide repeat protein [Poritiphilus flavus]|uniref:Tetratricopeptide repeat protein n=1 Tax=Poritiphilus flavus TaxID=2697053 RepID=A0A6L9ECS0_9FLAO|nr:tetratricopeptide repeat protein [Poritiphilus flavus]NAS12486.1 tetratricopeptide repeat protein [Poritiphilus flavus]
MKKWLTIALVLLGFAVYSQNEGLFNRATSAYNEGDYEKAIERYMEILDKGQHSAALYYNLGNSYYKLNQIAPSIYYYEKALLLQPNDPEIKTNLSYARNMTLDAIEALPETSLSRIYNSITGLFTFDEWSYVGVGFMLLFVLAYLAFYYLRYSSHKRIAFVTSMISLILVVVCLVFAFMQYRNFETDQPAIVFAEESVVKSEPNQRSSQVFVLHEGTKVNVLDQLEDYRKIQLVDGKTGWIQAEDVKLLKDF